MSVRKPINGAAGDVRSLPVSFGRVVVYDHDKRNIALLDIEDHTIAELRAAITA